MSKKEARRFERLIAIAKHDSVKKIDDIIDDWVYERIDSGVAFDRIKKQIDLIVE